MWKQQKILLAVKSDICVVYFINYFLFFFCIKYVAVLQKSEMCRYY
jgi:hypothetical protein